MVTITLPRAVGDTGDQGPKGDKGNTGDTGPQGLQGLQGVKGDKGDPGGTSDLIGTRQQAQAMTIGPEFAAVRTTGYAAPGDGGGALYKRVASEPTHAGKFHSADGQWWEIAEESVSPEDYGALGNGVFNDGPAIKKALEYALSTGVRFQAKGKQYLVDNFPIDITNTATTPVSIDWGGALVKFLKCGIFIGGPAAFLTTSFAVDPKRGDPKVTLTSVAGIRQGDMVEVLSPAAMHGDILALHYYPVAELDGADVYIEGTVCGDINPQQVIDSGESGAIVVRVSHRPPGVVVSNGRFEQVDNTGVYGCLTLSGQYRAVTNNLEFSGHCRTHLSLHYNCHTMSINTYVRDFGYISKDSGYVNLPSAPQALSFGYGIAISRNYSSVVKGLVAGHGWHASDVARGQMYVHYEDVICHRNAYGLVSHGGVWNATYLNCEFRGTQGMLVSGVNHLVVKGCRFLNTKIHGCTHGQHITALITDNYVHMPNEAPTRPAFAGGPASVSAGGVSAGDTHILDLSLIHI